MLPTTPPGSTLFFFSLAAIVTFLMTLANRFFMNPEKLKAWRKEISDYYRQLREAQKSGDKKQLEKLMKKQQYILQLNAKISLQTTKVMFIFLIPLWIVWFFLGGIYGGADIAYFPGLGWHLYIPLLPWPITSLFWWYTLCSLLFSTLFSHILGLVSME